MLSSFGHSGQYCSTFSAFPRRLRSSSEDSHSGRLIACALFPRSQRQKSNEHLIACLVARLKKTHEPRHAGATAGCACRSPSPCRSEHTPAPCIAPASPRSCYDRLAPPRLCYDRLASPRSCYDRLASPRLCYDRQTLIPGRRFPPQTLIPGRRFPFRL